MRFAIWSTTTPREHSTHQELFRRQLEEAELAERIGIDQMWFLEHHLQPSATPSPNLMIAAASQRTRRIRFANMVNILPFRNPLLVAEEAAMLDNLTGAALTWAWAAACARPNSKPSGSTRRNRAKCSSSRSI